MPSISLPVAILGAGALGVAGSVGTSLLSSNAAGKAADAQIQAAQTAANTQLGIYNQTRSDLMPYSQFGQSAISQLAKMFGLASPGSPAGTPGTGVTDPNSPMGQLAAIYGIGTGGPSAATAANATSALTQYPGYQFGLNQGQTALDRSAASRGLLLSGAQLKDSQTFGQGYAMQQAWNPYVSGLTNYANNYNTSLSGFAGLGENASAQSGNQGVTTGQGVANSQLAAGQAAASGIVGSSNAINAGINSGIGAGLNSSLLAYQLSNGQYGSGMNGAINSGSVMGVSNGGYNYLDAQAGR